MEIQELLELVASELKLNKTETKRSSKRIEKSLDKLAKSQTDLKKTTTKTTKIGVEGKMTSGLLKEINRNISSQGVRLNSTIKKEFGVQNKLLKRISAPSKTTLGRTIFDPLSIGKEQREERAAKETERSNDLLEDIIKAINGGVKKENSKFGWGGLLLSFGTFVTGFLAGLQKSINDIGNAIKGVTNFFKQNKIINSFMKLFSEEGMIGKLLASIRNSKFITSIEKFVVKTGEIISSIIGKGKTIFGLFDDVKKFTTYFSKIGEHFKPLLKLVSGVGELTGKWLMPVMAIYEAVKGLWDGEGIADKLKLMGAGILGVFIGWPAELLNIVGGWFDIEWMKEVDFGKKEWWIKQTDKLTAGFDQVLNMINNTVLSPAYWKDDIFGPLVDSLADTVWKVSEWFKDIIRNIPGLGKFVSDKTENPNSVKRKEREERIANRKVNEAADQLQVEKFHEDEKRLKLEQEHTKKLEEDKKKLEDKGILDILGDAFSSAISSTSNVVNSSPSTPTMMSSHGKGSQTNGTDRVIARDNNLIEKRSGGTRSWRNNNPGNLRFANQTGAIGQDNDGFAIFNSLEEGEAARKKQVFELDGVKRKLTIKQMIEKYAPKSENDTPRYIKIVSEAAGVSADTKLVDLTPDQQNKVMTAMKKHEGFKEGVVSVSPNKGTSNLTAQNTITPVAEPAKTTPITDAKKETLLASSVQQQAPVAIGKIGGDTTNIISNSTLNANFPYQTDSKMKFAFGVA
jgi:hypothetical protein